MRREGILKHYFNDRHNYITEWLFPAKCPVCFGVVLPRDALLHKECREKLPFLKEPLCKRCGRPLGEETAEYCGECEEDRKGKNPQMSWDIGRCAFSYQDVVAPAVWNLKQYGTRETVAFFAHEMTRLHAAYLLHLNPGCIVPVPLHPLKRRQRGFNQAELLARAVSEAFPRYSPPVLPLLKKVAKTAEQKSLSGAERKRNLTHAFCLDEDYLGQLPPVVLLVDDVVTTGSTLAACAAVLKAHGVKRVGFLCACFSEGE